MSFRIGFQSNVRTNRLQNNQLTYTTTIDLLRHGLPESHGSLTGQSDAVLTPEGYEQMKTTMAESTAYSRVVSSPLQRCRIFSEAFSQQHSLPLTIDTNWQEMNFGLWDGMPYETLHQKYPKALTQFWDDPWHNTPPEGETLQTFYQRIGTAWQHLLKHHKGERVLLVCHSGTIRMLLASVLEIDLQKNIIMPRFNIPYGSLSQIEIYHDESGKHWPRIMFISHQG